MMNTFVSSQGFRFGVSRLGGISLSLVTHASVITFAAFASGRPDLLTNARLSRAEPSERVRFVEHTAEGASSRAARAARSTKRAVRWAVPELSAIRAVIDASIAAIDITPVLLPETDFAGLTSGAEDFVYDHDALLSSLASRVFARPTRDGAYSADVVERTVWPQRNNPSPRYPPTLLRAGIEASFDVQFVVDSTGRVDAKTLAFPKAAHPMLVASVREALLHSRYFPAELAGARVRQLVQQQFSFVISSR